MTLTSRLSSQVPFEVQDRGRDYFRRGAVAILEGDNFFVDATVQGSRSYDVALERTKKAIKAWCSCPYCDDHLAPCKHIWATLLAAEAQGHLGGTGTAELSTLKVDDSLAVDDAEGGD